MNERQLEDVIKRVGAELERDRKPSKERRRKYTADDLDKEILAGRIKTREEAHDWIVDHVPGSDNMTSDEFSWHAQDFWDGLSEAAERKLGDD